MPECKEAGVRSFAAMPVNAEGKLLGVIGLASMQERDFSAQKELLERMTAAGALALDKILTYETLRQRINDLEGQLTDRTAELIVRNKELERLNRLFVDREFRIKSLKDRLKLCEGQQSPLPNAKLSATTPLRGRSPSARQRLSSWPVGRY